MTNMDQTDHLDRYTYLQIILLFAYKIEAKTQTHMQACTHMSQKEFQGNMLYIKNFLIWGFPVPIPPLGISVQNFF